MRSALLYTVRYGVIRAIRNAGLAMFLGSGLAWAEPVTVAALGDSLTQGYGLQPQDGFVAQLGDWLEAEGTEITLINAGVSGDTTAGGLSRVDWTLTPDVEAVIVALGGNDLLRGIDPAESKRNLDGILSKISERGLPVLLVGMDAPSNYGADFERAFDAMYPDLADQYDAVLYPNFLQALAALEDRQAALAQYMQRDGIHPNSEGVALIVNDLGPVMQRFIEQVKASLN